MLIITTLAPVGVAYTYEPVTPMKKHTTEMTDEQIVTVLNFLQTRIDVREGNMIRLEMSSAPIILIPSTIVIAVKKAISIL